MKYVLSLVLALVFTIPIFGQSSEVVSKEGGITTVVHNSSIVQRAGKRIFKASMFIDAGNYYNSTIIVDCKDYSHVILMTEGKDEGIDFIGVDDRVFKTPLVESRIYKAMTVACKKVLKIEIPKPNKVDG